MSPASKPSKTKRAPQAPQRSGPDPKVLAIVGGVVALAVVLGIVFAVAGGDDDDGGDRVATEGDAGEGGTAAADPLVFAPVEVGGDPLDPFESRDGDPAVGTAAPMLSGRTFADEAIAVEPGEPTLLVFLAHWCPHCQAEVPVLVDLAGEGAFDGIRLVAVATGTNPQAPNFPPADWLDGEGWPGEVLVDDQDSTAARAFGLTSYPYLVAVDADGNVTGRASGELPPDDVEALVATATG